MGEQTVRRTVDFHEFNGLKQDITDMKSLMSRMVEAMSRITVIEERQHTATEATNRALVRMEQITEKQHAYEIANAGNSSLANRMNQVETTFLELHVEGERNKARFGTVVWMVRGLWAVVGSGGLLWLFHAISALPLPIK